MLVQIVDDVRRWFINHGITAAVDEGVEARNEQLNHQGAGRVVFAVANPIESIAPTHIGEDDSARRQLLNALLPINVYFAGFDWSQAGRDFAHRRVCLALWEATVQAVQFAYHGAHSWGAANWSDPRKELRHGAELVATLTLNVPLFDVGGVFATPTPVPGDPKPVT